MLARSNLQISKLNRVLKTATNQLNQITEKERDAQSELEKQKKLLVSIRQELLDAHVDAAEKDLQVKRMIAKSAMSSASGGWE